MHWAVKRQKHVRTVVQSKHWAVKRHVGTVAINCVEALNCEKWK